jgi:hypothetical protein
LKDVLFARKKQKTVLNVAANAKTQTRMKQTRNFAEFWSSLFAEAQVTYLTFILLTLQTYKLTKLKTTFGRNLLYFHKGLKHDRDILARQFSSRTLPVT